MAQVPHAGGLSACKTAPEYGEERSNDVRTKRTRTARQDDDERRRRELMNPIPHDRGRATASNVVHGVNASTSASAESPSPALGCLGCIFAGILLIIVIFIFAPSEEVRERMRVEQTARNAEVAKAIEAAQLLRNAEATQSARNAEAAKATEAAQAARNAEVVQAARNAEAARPKMTYVSFLSVREGMTYREVEAIVGKPDKLISSVEIEGIQIVMVGWDAGVTMTYENGKLIGKAQFGLR